MFGPAVGVKADETGQVIIDENGHRRTLYTQQRRSQPVALLQAFDAPVMQTNCEARPSSTVATQSLMLMNGDFLLQQAFHLAGRLVAEPAIASCPELTGGIPSMGGEPVILVWQFGYGPCEWMAPEGKVRFTPLPHWAGTTWQGGPELPDPKIDWVHLHAKGGHPCASPDHCAIRRWTAPSPGHLTVRGTLSHGSENGDGVRGRLVSSRLGIVGEWVIHHGSIKTDADDFMVEAGDTLDFITDGREHVTSDSFEWEVTLSLTQSQQPLREAGTPLTNVGESVSTTSWTSSTGFHGPTPASHPIEIGSIVRAWQLCYQRMPTRDELRSACDFIRENLTYLHAHPERVPSDRSPELQSLTNLGQVLMSSNEFLYVD